MEKQSPIKPRSVQAARLRYSFVASRLKYTISLVVLCDDTTLSLIRAAPMIGRGWPLADVMAREAGIRSLSLSCKPACSVGPARQLWHPVSARAVVIRPLTSLRRVWPWAV